MKKNYFHSNAPVEKAGRIPDGKGVCCSGHFLFKIRAFVSASGIMSDSDKSWSIPQYMHLFIIYQHPLYNVNQLKVPISSTLIQLNIAGAAPHPPEYLI